MYSLKTVFILALAVFASANPHLGRLEQETDADLFRKFIECARIAIITGIPEIGVPSHDPLEIIEEINYDFTLSPSLRGSFSLNNMVIEDIPNWEVRQFDPLISNEEFEDIFNYTIYWPKMVFKGDWEFSLHFIGIPLGNKGTITVEMDHVNFVGIFDFIKPGPNRAETIKALELDVTTQEVQLEITNLGELGDNVNDVGGKLLSDLMKDIHNEALSEGLRNKLINDWILKPERIDVLIDN
ncbi:hypothetical protein NQ314_005970 [Rhamnusium bicolor]|uniref:Uncharacterized protein n=1 Tax=Rhamnusium bicolor TaxID=1586634 RepID=A0AAV8ZBS4_9CUCU|nr:hypothetical protein NQ314_005970 [Rhamnusium bicolor]